MARVSAWRAVIYSLSEGVDRSAVFGAICDGGLTTGRYVMMSSLAAAIATLGLLLSSPAVVIGAMLLSPLMDPIILLGFAFWTIDWRATRRAVISLAIGLGVALAVAFLLTLVSPLKEPTAEVLARTRPNLFDLLVAAFSGVAGGYAVIRQRGEAVIGVAIATALMPPIATVGFGLGTANWPITLGALLLFATNLVAIALAAAGMAALYGFRPHLANRSWFGQGLVIVILGALCIPLTLSLNTIALESRTTTEARAAIRAIFGPKARITSLTARSVGHALRVDGLVATPKYISTASSQIKARLAATLHNDADVSLDQVVLADPTKFEAPAAAPAALPDPVLASLQALRDAEPFPAKAIAFDPKLRGGVVLLRPQDGLDLTAAKMLEDGLRTRKGLEQTQVIPPVSPLPPTPILLSKAGPAQLGANLGAVGWALQRWGVRQATATVCGLSPREFKRAMIDQTLQTALPEIPATVAAGRGRACRSDSRSHPYLQLSLP